MNHRFVSLVLGFLFLIESFMMTVCLGFSYFADNNPAMNMAWWGSLVIALAVGLGCVFFGRKHLNDSIFRREAFAVVGLGWLGAGVLGALPFILPPLALPVWDALFECYSGFTTTGATIFADLEILPPSIILWRSITQWMGGMGIVVLFVALLGFLGIGGRSLFHSETSALAEKDLKPRIRSLGMSYLFVYLAWTGVGILGLSAFGMTPFDAINHAMCAISTGGFSPYNASVAHFDSWSIHLWLVLIMFAGGIAFPVHYQLFILRKRSVLKRNEELHVYTFILLFAFVLVGVDLLTQRPEIDPISAVVQSLFQVTSIMTTTGFVTGDFNIWPETARIALLGLMVIGGCSGSTGGGVKVARFVVFWKTALRQLKQTFRPNRIIQLKMNNRPIDEPVITGVTFYLALYFILLVIGIFILSLLEPSLSLTTIFSAVLACFNNIGPGLGDVGPVSNYALFNPMSKLWLALYMILGRLELFAILILFLPSFWKKF